MNGGYSSSLDFFIESHPQIKLWTHGHTHETFDYVVVGHHMSMETAYKAHRFSPEEVALLKDINALSNTTILAVFTKPYAVLDIPFIKEIPLLFFGYQNAPQIQQYAAQVLYGKKVALGVLPVSLKGIKH